MKLNSTPILYFRFMAFVIFIAMLVLISIASSASLVAAQEPLPTGEVEGQIVGGVDVNPPGNRPWQVALISGSASNFYSGQFCGGSLVAQQWVLTAAHCVVSSGSGAYDWAPISPAQVDIVAGVHDLSNPGTGYQRKDVIQVIVHPDYNDWTYDSDIALLKLASPVTPGGSGESSVAIIPLVSSSIGSLEGTNAVVTGWGTNFYSQNYSSRKSKLQEVGLPVISNTICNQPASYGGDVTSNMLCAGYSAGGYDSCQGDSGGPLAIQVGSQWQLAGIVSWGNGCGWANYYGVYTRVSNFTNWVKGYTEIWSTAFSYDEGWRVDLHPRTVADMNGDGKTDLVGLGYSGVYVCLTNSAGNGVASCPFWTQALNYDEGWRVDLHPRTVADMNGDGKADLVGFGYSGVYVCLTNATGNGVSSCPFWTQALNYDEGWRVNMHPRTVADMNGDDKADLVGFGYSGVYVCLTNAAGNGVENCIFWTQALNYDEGWRIDMHPRTVADMNGDGKADLIGFGYSGVYVCLTNAAGNGVASCQFWSSAFNYNEGWRVDLHPRTVADVNRDGKADLVGFGYDGVYACLTNTAGNGVASCGPLLMPDFSYNEGWYVNMHPRMMGDANGDGRDDIIGFGNPGVFVGISK